MSEEKIFKVWKGKKNVSVEFRVSGKKELKEKFREKKSKCFGWKFKVEDFAKFVFTGWALCSFAS